MSYDIQVINNPNWNYIKTKRQERIMEIGALGLWGVKQEYMSVSKGHTDAKQSIIHSMGTLTPSGLYCIMMIILSN